MPRENVSKKDKSLVFARAKNRCEYCQCRADTSLASFEVEHIIPIVLGGQNGLSNLALACRGCNSRKSIRIRIKNLDSGKNIELFHPRKHSWKTHFEWDEEYLKIVGKTSIGKVTLDALKLNRIGVINIRRLMILGGIHPPLDTI